MSLYPSPLIDGQHCATITLKLVNTSDGTTRRISLPKASPLTFANLLQFAALPPRPSPSVTYVDDEGDTVTITNDAELQEAVEISEKQLRLLIDPSATAIAAAPPSPAAKVVPPPAAPTEAAPSVARSPIATDEDSKSAVTPVKHWGIECDVTGQCPIVGTRYHLRGQNYDLCETAFAALEKEQQALFEVIEKPRLRRRLCRRRRNPACHRPHPSVVKCNQPTPSAAPVAVESEATAAASCSSPCSSSSNTEGGGTSGSPCFLMPFLPLIVMFILSGKCKMCCPFVMLPLFFVAMKLGCCFVRGALRAGAALRQKCKKWHEEREAARLAAYQQLQAQRVISSCVFHPGMMIARMADTPVIAVAPAEANRAVEQQQTRDIENARSRYAAELAQLDSMGFPRRTALHMALLDHFQGNVGAVASVLVS